MPRKKHQFLSSIRTQKFHQRQDSLTDQLHDIYHVMDFLGINPKELPRPSAIKEDKGPYVDFLTSSMPEVKGRFSSMRGDEVKSFAICVANLFGAYDAADLIKQF